MNGTLRQSTIQRYLFSICTVAVFSFAHWITFSRFQISIPMTLFLSSVVISAWIAGTGPGILAVILSVSAHAWFSSNSDLSSIIFFLVALAFSFILGPTRKFQTRKLSVEPPENDSETPQSPKTESKELAAANSLTGSSSPIARNLDAPLSFHGKSVLLVEDTLDNQFLYQRILGKLGLKVSIANNGQEALELIGQQNFDVILMDMQMPVMDGYTATQRLRQNQWTLPIIAMTAHSLVEDRERCLASGCDDFMSKPVSSAQMAKVLSQYIH